MAGGLTPQDDARLQLAVGVFDAWVWAAVVWAFGTGGLAILHPLLGILGWAGCLLFPFGALEILLALHALRADDPLPWSRRLARLQVLSVVLGGLPAAWVGWRVLSR